MSTISDHIRTKTDVYGTMAGGEEATALADAIRSVLSLHNGIHIGTDWATCRHCGYAWPCPTIAAVAEAIGVAVPLGEVR